MILAGVECAVIAAVEVVSIGQAQAQFREEKYPFLRRQRPRGFFQQLFGPYQQEPERSYRDHRREPADHSQAPSARKHDKADAPTTTILVLGDGMADWLGYGLEESFAESPEVAIVRKDKQRSGLLRYEAKSDLDWWHVAREILTQEKATYVVMMLGASDRDSIRERDLAREAEKKKAEKEKAEKAAREKAAQDNPGAAKKDDKKDEKKEAEADKPRRSPSGVVEFRSERWANVYSRRVDETIAALKSKGVPVFWVGLPSIRGSRSTADAVHLNDLFRARAERAGIVYVDIWDGFVDDSGRYVSHGPDYEGQTRRLRSSDGVYFTKAGARKLAHYVEREIRRYMSNRATPVALPTGPITPQPDGKPAVRPTVGPVVPLTTVTGNADQLLGASGTRLGFGDEIASSVLVNGEPLNAPTGRADDFTWRQGGEASAPAAAPVGTATAAAAAAAAGRNVRQLDMKGGDQTTPEPKPEPKRAAVPEPIAAEAKPADNPPPKPVRHSAPRRERTFFPFNPFGLFR
jgi:hypothetical protein